MRIAVCGGVYSNPYALAAFCHDARRHGAEALYCLGDLGGYGAEPEAIWPLLTDHDITCVAGNYDVAIASGQTDCGCGYSDPRDQQFAQVMFDYTATHTSAAFARWMGTLPTERRESIGGCDVHLVHGSPLGLNDFWWQSCTEAEHRAKAEASGAQLILATHSGIPWTRGVGDALVVNVGVLGRPPNDGTRAVSYALVDLDHGRAQAEIVSLDYDWAAQVRSMRRAGLPEAFVHTNHAGWWATCLEILPVLERSRGRYHVYDSSVPALLEHFGLPPDVWPDDAPALPVRSLVGSPLLPTTVWTDDSGPGEPSPAQVDSALRDAVGPWGRWSARPLSTRHRAATPPRDGDVTALEPTLRRDGWRRHPDSDGPPALDPDTGHPLRAANAAKAYQLFAAELLTELADLDTGSPLACPVTP